MTLQRIEGAGNEQWRFVVLAFDAGLHPRGGALRWFRAAPNAPHGPPRPQRVGTITALADDAADDAVLPSEVEGPAAANGSAGDGRGDRGRVLPDEVQVPL